MLPKALAVIATFCCLSHFQSCGPPVVGTVIIHYRQSANFVAFEIPNTPQCQAAIKANGSTQVGPGGLWILYEITKIENNQANAHDFPLTLSKVYVTYSGQNNNTANYPVTTFGQDNQCLQTATDTTVVAGTVLPYLGRFMININTNVLTSDDTAQFNLFYPNTSGFPIVFVREQGTRPNGAGFASYNLCLPDFTNARIVDTNVSLILNCAVQNPATSSCMLDNQTTPACK